MKRNISKIAGICLAGVTACMILGGCTSRKDSKEYDFYIFNGKSENAKAMEAVCQEYEAETGVKVKVFSLGTTELMETLRAEMNSKEMPTIFSSNADTITEWMEGGFVQDLNQIKNKEFQKCVKTVPESMDLSGDNGESYGIPYNIEGYGLIADKRMITDLFGLSSMEEFIADFKKADYEEFQELFRKVDTYIREDSAGSIQLNGSIYTLVPEKTELTARLNGVISIAAAEKWTYGNHYSNYPLNTVFDSFRAVKEATDEQLDNLRIPIEKSVA